jgi:hypothetical protein
MKQVLLVTATKTKTLEEFQQRPLAKSLQQLSDIRYPDDTLFDFEIVKDNSAGLPEVYNRYLTEKNKDKLLLLVHDDLEIHDLNLVEKLNGSPWDITGLAGAGTFEFKDKNLWHTCSKRESQSGTVFHPLCWQEGNQLKVDPSRLLGTTFGPVPSRALILDALFMCINVEKALEADFKFDTDFKFHHWDISSCLIANERKLKMGTYPIFCLHHGLGNSFMTPEWEESNKKFKEKWQSALKKPE